MRGLIGQNGGRDLNDNLYYIRRNCLLNGIEQEDELKSIEAKIQFIANESYDFEVKRNTLMKYNEALFPYTKKNAENEESQISSFVKKFKQLVDAGVVNK